MPASTPNTMRTRVNLADTVSSNYEGELARPYVAAALLSGETLANGYIATRENIAYKANIGVISTDTIVTATTCSFTDAGTVEYEEVVLTPQDLQVNLELCKSDWYTQFDAVNMGAGRINDSLAPDVQSFILEHVAGKVAQAVEKNIWMGNSAGAGPALPAGTIPTLFNGVDLALDPDGNGTGGTMNGDSTNSFLGAGANGFIDAVEDLLATVDSEVIGADDFTVYCNPKQALAYRKRLAGLGYGPGQDYYQGVYQPTILGYKMAVCPGIDDKRIYCGPASNVVFGTNLLTDHIEARVVDMSMTDGSDTVRIVMRMTAGVAIPVSTQFYGAAEL